VARIGFHHGFAPRVGDAAAIQFEQEGRVRRVAECHVAPTRRKIEHGSVFGDDDVEAGEITGNATEIRELSAGNQDHGDVPSADLGDRFPDGGIEIPVDGDGAVVIEGEGGELHPISTNRRNLHAAARTPEFRQSAFGWKRRQVRYFRRR